MTPEEFKLLYQPELPNQPGVYQFFDRNGKLLYVGKAKNLKNRISSYFNHSRYTSTRIKLISLKTTRIEFTIVNSEQDALLLEDRLIKKQKPRYNIQLRDDKTYPYICIKNERFPRIFLTRRLVNDGSEYLGPFTSVARVRFLLDFIRKIYPLRTCNYNLSKKNIQSGKFKVCLEYHIGNCLGPCSGLQSEEDYMHSVGQIRQIIRGKTNEVIRQLQTLMEKQAADLNFEAAAETKKRIEQLKKFESKSPIINIRLDSADVFGTAEDENYIYINFLKVLQGSVVQSRNMKIRKLKEESTEELVEFAINEMRAKGISQATEIITKFRITLEDSEVMVTNPQRGDKKHLLELSIKNALYYKNRKLKKKTGSDDKQLEILKSIQQDFRLPELPVRMECFDNSNIQGNTPVASVVVFINGKPAKKEYRHYNVNTVIGPDDYSSMEEIVYRRYKRILEEGDELPQLIVIDGGKGQLNAACKSLEKLGIKGKVSIIAIAKKLEEIYFPDDPLPLHISKKSVSLKIIQHLRNEAHRFAITFHKKKRQKAKLHTSLTHIKGIGEKTASKLLQQFRSIKKIRQASLEELALIVGKQKALLIKAYFESADA